MEARLVLPARALNGECPVWHSGFRQLFWVDIREPALHAFDPATGVDRRWEMPAWIGCFALTERGALVALRTGLWAFDCHTGALEALAPAPFDPRRFMFNDGGCDPAGRFFAGPMHLPLDGGAEGGPKTAPVWRYRPAHRDFIPVSPPVKTANGTAWSPDGRTLYHSDTDRKIIWACDYDVDSGAVTNRRVFADVAVEDPSGGPDGAAVDRDGFYWCAVFANGCLLRYDPAGRLERRVPLPVKYPTMPAFGGPDMKTLYVTSATWPLPPGEHARLPLEGCLFALEPPTAGTPPRFFDPSR